jgi:glycerol kinase
MQVDAQAAGLSKIKVLRVDGGASQNDMLMQTQADVMQCLVRRPVFQETTALGAALAAGIGIGLWTEEEVLLSHAYGSTDFRPTIGPKRAAERFRKWNRAVERSVQLADLEDERDE